MSNKEINQLGLDINGILKLHDMTVRLAALSIVAGSYVATNEITLETLVKAIKESAKLCNKLELD